jgi:hypothetical protein
MSIFKSTFKPFVVRQIKARQNLLSKVERTVELAKYVSSKTPWIRMTSFVNYQESSNLAKKYILQGGTLYDFNTESNTAKLRSGIGGRGASYGGDISSTQYGIRPMPGITSMTTRSLGAYGSLTEATVKFYAWDVTQLEELSILFLRPGYKVLLEWGWSMYLDTSDNGDSHDSKTNSKILTTDYSASSIKNTPFNTIDCFNESITQEGIYDSLQKLRHKYSGNYDGVLGSIRNFEYELMPNGSYECTTVLMSIGDVIDTIRMNDTISGTVSGEDQNTNENSEIKSQFELLFDGYCKLSNTNNRNLKKNSFISFIDADIKPEDEPYVDRNIYTTKKLSAVLNPIPVSDEPPLDDRYNYYIQFAYLVQILNSFKNLFSEKSQKLINIEIPSGPLRAGSFSNGLCQASFNSISINPNTVLIRNSKATIFKDKNDNVGFIPSVYNIEDPISEIGAQFKEYLYSDTNLGIIGNLYINIGKIISLYKELAISGQGYVYVGTYISKLLSEISFSLGSINDFDKFVTDNKICIIDKHYTELPSESSVSSKFKVNILGNSSIVRSHKINSKIFPSQATMIAVAAQSRQNVASLQTSTYNYLNEGLVDRLFKETTNLATDLLVSEEESKRSLLNQILVLIRFVRDYVLDNSNISVFNNGNLATMNAYLNSLLVELDCATDYKAVIPISVELTLDGISGLTIGEIFTVDKNVLPKDYKQKSIGFIVTKINNEILTNGWKTTLGSQICILDQQEKQLRSLERSSQFLRDLLEQSRKNIGDTLRSIRYYKILAALYMDVLRENIFIKDVEGELDFKKDKSGRPRALYSRAAVQESGGSEITYGDLLTEFRSTYKRLYPKITETRINRVTGTTREGQAAVNQTTTTTQSRVTDISKNGILENIIVNMSYYIDMKDSDIKNIFQSEMTKVRSGYEQHATPPDYTRVFDTGYKVLDYLALIAKNPLSAGTVTGQAMLNATFTGVYLGAIASTTFNLINIENAIDNITGRYILSTPLATGYPYFTDKQ